MTHQRGRIISFHSPCRSRKNRKSLTWIAPAKEKMFTEAVPNQYSGVIFSVPDQWCLVQASLWGLLFAPGHQNKFKCDGVEGNIAFVIIKKKKKKHPEILNWRTGFRVHLLWVTNYVIFCNTNCAICLTFLNLIFFNKKKNLNRYYHINLF